MMRINEMRKALSPIIYQPFAWFASAALFACLLASTLGAQTAFTWGTDAGIVLGEGLAADPEGQVAVERLSGLLERVTGETVEANAPKEKNIVLGLVGDFPQVVEGTSLSATDRFGREGYLLRSSETTLYLIGASPLAVQQGVADLAYRWGYRLFFPTRTWEILPAPGDLSVAVDAVESPAYYARDLFDVNFLEGERELYERWRAWNRLGSGFLLNTKHAYDGIYHRNREAFSGHPEYFAEVDGERTPDAAYKKFNVSNPELQAIVIDDAWERFDAPSARDSISMDPSDFGGWDNTGEASAEWGSPTNQAVSLANLVASEVADVDGKYVGMYAYYQHQYPPTIPVEENLIVSFATRFLAVDRDLMVSIADWRQQGLKWVGIRDYASFWPWDLAMPGRSQGGNLAYLEDSIRMFYANGARFYTSETESAWGAYGLGSYVTARLLWNPQEDVDAIVSDFLEKSFGPASGEMARFYDMLNGEASVLARQRTAADYYAVLLDAYKAARGHADARQRIVELLAYVRYIELFCQLEIAPQEQKQARLEELYRWVFRISSMQMVPTRAIAFRPRLGGILYMYSGLEHPSESERKAMLAAGQAEGVDEEALLDIARQAVEQSSPVTWPDLPVVDQATSSPNLRYNAGFLVPMRAHEQVDIDLSLRLYGFSWLPRYAVVDPDGDVVARGRVGSLRETITLSSEEAGSYRLIFEPTLILVQAESSRSFALLPSVDFHNMEMVKFTGSLFFASPPGEAMQIAVGGQASGEKTSVRLSSGTEVALAQSDAASGDDPLVYTLDEDEAVESYELELGRPKDGSLEDQFLRFQGAAVPVLYLHAEGAKTDD